MKISFRRDTSANYMVIENAESFSSGDFAVKMLIYNNIPGLLCFDHESINGRVNLLYNISSKQAMHSFLEMQRLSCEMLKGFVYSLMELTQTLEEYLLDVNNIILKKECIFIDLKSGRYSYCYDPYYNGDLQTETGIIFDELLSCVDYDDAEAVRLIYSLDRQAHTENFVFSSLAELIDGSAVKPDGISTKEEDEKEDIVPIREEEILDGLADEAARKAPGFFQKLSAYLNGKSVYDIVEDIDSGQIASRIKESAPIFASGALQTGNPERKGKRKKKAEDAFGEAAFNEPLRYTMENREDALVFEEIKLAEAVPSRDEFPDTGLLDMEAGKTRRLVGIGNQTGIIMIVDTYPFTIGKLKESADAICTSPAVSRLHCRIHENSIEEGSYFFEDLNSKNGSYINDIRVNPYKKVPLRPGDIIRLADEEYVFK